MSTQLQLRRGTTAQHSTFTGASGEITIDTDKKTVVVHDGTTAGGRALPQFDSSGNLGIGVTPDFDATVKAIEVGYTGNFFGGFNGGGGLYQGMNAKYSSGWKYAATGIAAKYEQGTSTPHKWSIAGSGSANGAITWTDAMTLDSSGNLGIGTASPSSKLTVAGGHQNSVDLTTTNSAYDTFYKVYGKQAMGYYGGWSTTTLMLNAAGDFTSGVSIGSVSHPSNLLVTGNLLVGTTSAYGVGYTVTSTGYHYMKRSGTGLNSVIDFANDNGSVGTISTSGSSTIYATSSDYRLKEDIQPVATPIDRLNQLKPVNFAWKSDGLRCDGFLAHELQEVIPEAATGHKDEMRTEEYEVTPTIKDEEGNVIAEAVMGEREVPVYQGIDQSKIVPLLTAALQEAVAKIESLTQRIEALEYTKQGE